MRKINNIVIHCTATPQNASVRSILDYQHNVKGWKVAGYHFIIEADGMYKTPVNINNVSNGVAGHNSDSIHIAYIGGINTQGKAIDNRTLAQKEMLIHLIRSMKKLFPNAKVKGHRDFSDDKNGNGIIDPWERIKECPCFDAIPEYKDIRP